MLTPRLRKLPLWCAAALAVTTLPLVTHRGEPAGAAGEGARPNILFIIFDDARVEALMDVPEVLPLTKQWLAAAGTTFSEGYATTSLCCPERATIWSGRLPHNHGVVDNDTGDNLDREWIVPRYLRDAGYHTAIVGKFITNWKFRYTPPHFDEYAVFQGGYVGNRFMVKNPGAERNTTETAEYTTDYIAEKASSFITSFEARDEQPWFMQVSPHAPHNNFEAQKTNCELDDMYDWPARHDNTPTPPWKPSPAVTVEGNNKEAKADKVDYVRRANFPANCIENTHTGQMKTLLSADEMVDRIMQTLVATGELGNTMVILTSDNGWAFGERGVTSKALPYGEHVLVPFLVRWDGVFPAGAVDPRPVGGEDFLPTYLAASGYQPPELHYPLDGRSFLPGAPGRPVKFLEFGPVGKDTPPNYEGHRGIPTWASLRTQTWQYIEYYEDDNRTLKFREYYDLTTDPWELENLLADTNPANDPDVAALSAQLKQASTCVGTTGPNPCP